MSNGPTPKYAPGHPPVLQQLSENVTKPNQRLLFDYQSTNNHDPGSRFTAMSLGPTRSYELSTTKPTTQNHPTEPIYQLLRLINYLVCNISNDWKRTLTCHLLTTT
ncbi:hypothetical protein LOTGIDRAFT_169451 [Lottia gigantea]|uniref:Uncharacterized protein n=1 Tax=Lottia gigantea TaxID=225164 RepID=V3ZR85_LOTGI|nr:hypothetical protein LOTGIDRAFT_169451 [Lottia gigantea]ESO83381.1 hypothetical protein LOTGIDRAFT_169451 [Lottia gigantea]